ncbi:Pirin, variant 2 [Balamuthia mandrillaris]
MEPQTSATGTEGQQQQQQDIKVIRVVQAMETEEGAGARVKRSIGTPKLSDLDPFLMLDEFFVQPPAGFPDHPHRGFETVTYMLEGKFKHKDNKGHAGTIGPGDLQWMTAGRGIIHSEMPATEGVNHGLQLWINLAAKHKMTEPQYQELLAADIPMAREEGVLVRVIAGESCGVKAEGLFFVKEALLCSCSSSSSCSSSIFIIYNILFVFNSEVRTRTPTMYLDVEMEEGATFQQHIPSEYRGFVYVLSGEGKFGAAETSGSSGKCLVLSEGNNLSIQADKKLRFVILAGQPLNEPIAKYGPFVMNTKEEIQQAFIDYQTGRF